MKSNFEALKNISVDDYTSPNPVTIDENENLIKAFSIIEENGFRHLPVTKEGKIVGILSERAIHSLQDFSSLKEPKVKDCMQEDPISVNTGTSLMETAFLLSDKKIGSVLVLNNDGSLNGIFTTTDALNALIEIIRGDFEINS